MKTELHIKILAMGFFIFLFAAINLTAQDHWAKYENNPVLENTAWADGAAGPVVIFEDDAFKMWFSSAGAIAYAESNDGINWDINDNPAFPVGVPGDWDRYKYPRSVIRMNDTLKMWYSGSSDNFQYEISIGYAYKINDGEWYCEPDPVLENGEPGNWDETGVFQPVVYYDGLIYHMWYSGFEGTTLYDPMQEGYATSTDGINWDKHTNNPVIILGEDGSFYDTWVIGSCVLFVDNEYHMWFAGWDGYSTNPFKYWRLGHATSADGVEWTVQNDSMPVVDVGPAGSWDDRWARYSSVLIHEGQYKMWYDGSGLSIKIGYAEGFEAIEVPGDYATIQEGIDAANGNEVILVDTGTYFENINFKGKAITVTSKFLLDGDTNYINNTIIDASQTAIPDSASVVYFISGEDSTSIIKGFTIQGGSGTPSSWGDGISGGGIFCAQAGPKIEYNHIINNHCEGGGTFVSGGGIFSDTCSDRTTIITNNLISGNTCTSYESATGAVTGGGMSVVNDAIITNNTIINNSIFHGANGQAVAGGMECSFAKFIVKNNIIINNVAENTGNTRQPWGGGIYSENSQDGTLISGNIIENNTVMGNTPAGGGIGLWDNTGKIHLDKNVIKNNKASRGGGIAIGASNVFDITNNIISGNNADSTNSVSLGGGIYLTNGSSSKKSGIRNIGRDLNEHSEIKGSKSLIPVIANNTIIENFSYRGGGITARGLSNPFLAFNNIIFENSAVYTGNAIYLYSGDNAHLYNNDVNPDEIEGNGYWQGSGNIFVDPMIVDDMGHLGWASECANAGIYTLMINDVSYDCPTIDLDGDTRPYLNTMPDIGADEAPILYVGTEESKVQSPKFKVQIYPNPFSTSTTIKYQLEKPANIQLVIYNHLGEQVKKISRYQSQGKHQFTWHAETLPAGIYYCVLKTDYGIQTTKMIKLK